MLEALSVIGGGLSIAIATGAILGIRKAATLPGGSLGVGMMWWWQYGPLWAIVGGCLGLLGWFIYFQWAIRYGRTHRI